MLIDTSLLTGACGIIATWVGLYLSHQHSKASRAEIERTHVEKFTRLEVKVDTLWGFMLKDAEREVLKNGLATKNSPLTINPEALEMFSCLKDELRIFYKRTSRYMTDLQIAMELQRRFGDKIVYEVCEPNKLSPGAGILIALAVAKGDPSITLYRQEKVSTPS